MTLTHKQYISYHQALNKRFKLKRLWYKVINSGQLENSSRSDRTKFFDKVYHNNLEIFKIQGILSMCTRVVRANEKESQQ